ncbi:TonB-dependent receptor domain-containing protein [Acinetobacter larvae]|uniref:TonB-dependent receptor n=1 Tax=Acinetobacter larvae TaxID=1789224 RepID=A0A1B2LWP8_9GAMM|nr:TonB-dependent receptor [Acinetobacter larvae]AOA57309.1 hypothetical protein BFG52_02340 [Acinetobacter larvae]
MKLNLIKNSLSASILLALAGGSTAIFAAQEQADENIKKLETIVITATGYEQNIADAAASISVITAEELEKKSYTDITDALKNVPGVYVTGGGSNQSVMIRGMSSSYTLYLIDGKPMQGNDAFSPNGSYGGAPINFLPPMEAIERIEVIRGPASALYGSDAMGGVINIITKKHADQLTTSVNFEYIKADSSNKVNNDSTHTNLYLNAPLVSKLLSFQLAAGFLNQDESDYNGGGATKSGSDPEFKRKTLSTKFVYTPDDLNTFKFGYDYRNQERNTSPGKSVADTTEPSSSELEKYNYSLTHQYKKDRLLIESYIQYDKDKNPSRVGSKGYGIENQTITANSQGSYFFDKHALTVGVNYKKEELKDGATNGLAGGDISTLDRYQWSLFAEDTWDISHDLALTLSGRYDDNEDFGGQFSPKAYAVYKLMDGLNLKGGITAGYKAPTLRQGAPDFGSVSRGGGSIGNPDLEPETSLNYELGLAYSDPELGLEGSLTAFRTDFKDKISSSAVLDGSKIEGSDFYVKNPYLPYNANGWKNVINIDKAEIKGIELTTDYQVLDHLKYRQSYTYTDSEQKSGANKGNPLNDIPKHMFNAGLDWDVTDQVLLWSQVNYRGKTAGGSSNADEKDPAYTFIDLGAVYKYSDNLKFTAGVYNLANKEVTTDDGYSYILDGRRYSVGVNFKF